MAQGCALALQQLRETQQPVADTQLYITFLFLVLCLVLQDHVIG